MAGNDVTLPIVTESDSKVTSIDQKLLEVAVGRKVTSLVPLTSYM